jgi:phosphocarrier protein
MRGLLKAVNPGGTPGLKGLGPPAFSAKPGGKNLNMSEAKSEIPAVTQELWVENRLGLHARPAMKITNLALQFEADLVLEKDGTQVNARDLLAILALDCPQGTRLVLKATGPDASEAVTSVSRLFAHKFGESW